MSGDRHLHDVILNRVALSPLVRSVTPPKPAKRLNSNLLRPQPVPSGKGKPIGQVLVDMGALTPDNLLRASAMRQREDTRIGDIFLAHGMVTEDELHQALGAQYHAEIANLSDIRPDVRLIDRIGADECLRRGILPWRQAGGTVIIASCRPEEFEAALPELSARFGPVRMALTSETALHEALLHTRQRRLAAAAETRVAAHESCREMDLHRLTQMFSALGVAGIVLALLSPLAAAVLLIAWAVLTLAVATGLKLAAGFAQARTAHDRKTIFEVKRGITRLPTVSVMVPLFKEREIATRLIKRLSRLNYPRELLDICLVVEEDDQVTQDAIAHTDMPRWMRQIIVPRGRVKTKPRALNFALDFCRGSIVGIYDAEDAPEPEQIHKVVAHFAQTGPEVACVQGVLDFYNARTNWLSRCFTVEYASWFRVILPGYERMGLTVPLGGTTLFFRRDAIEELGGWDAHNVTEDADLGIRLARHGYRTELLSTVTEEEANCRLWPWVKQRSRWLKGYAMTYAVHMRQPQKLWRDLGPWRFFGVQALFLGTLSQFILAPFLWSFWMFPLGLPHPMRAVLPHDLLVVLGGIFLFSEAVTVATGMVATSTRNHRWLWPWVPTLHLYYPLATLAALKALWEMVSKPYYWDKTTHGVDDFGVDDFEFADEIQIEAAGTFSDGENSLSPLLTPSSIPGPASPGPVHPGRDGAPAPSATETTQDGQPPTALPALSLWSEGSASDVFQHLEKRAGDRLPEAPRRLTFGLDLGGAHPHPGAPSRLRAQRDPAPAAQGMEMTSGDPLPEPELAPARSHPAPHAAAAMAQNHLSSLGKFSGTPLSPYLRKGARQGTGPDQPQVTAFADAPALCRIRERPEEDPAALPFLLGAAQRIKPR
ncbi:glycosyltransferase family 2 protein [Celeribacter neptunius]|uniref:Glycosyltransferase, catalytic subunit of cellulose synthase and poly-beta-1,6-N-acetylglucosamine synthase n=1 Tax=Celeribacter neptunius TaxID=588602 RepID=A0A1I3P4T5_9RHOB|nr:glycosyltransferase family 2 protein [Celeribacter neptunius]SFJ16429.1 Glycosyltransferase, catalytic subunit of cellulose synthase and poly-beta-1,6-N-acetylglucosamine synthase [Celeribacter neptunius]